METLSLFVSLFLQICAGWQLASWAWLYPSFCLAGPLAFWAVSGSKASCITSPVYSSLWEVCEFLHVCSLKNSLANAWCLISKHLVSSHLRYLLHHLSLHLCGRHKLRTVPLPTLPLQPSRWYKPRLRLVHVQCLGRTRTDPHSWVLLHAGTIDTATPTIPYLLS